MEPNTQTKDLDMPGAHNEIPQEVASCKGLDQARRASVAVYALNSAMLHVSSLFICEHYPEGEGVDQKRLDEGHGVDVPIDACASVELGVDVWEQPC